jgi:enoyl-CoA hydratase
MEATDAGPGSAVQRPDLVLAESVGTIRILTLNRPDKLNAADLALQQGLVARLAETAADPSVRAVILTGAGRLFCAGGDRSVAKAAAEGHQPDAAEHSRVYASILHAMLDLPVPIIAAVNGGAIGFGADLVALCDQAVIGEDGYLADPHVLYGLPASPVTQIMWPRLTSHAIAKELLTTGRKVAADEALKLGLVNRIAPRGEEVSTALAIARVYQEVPAASLAATKRALNRPILDAFAARGFGPGSAAA